MIHRLALALLLFAAGAAAQGSVTATIRNGTLVVRGGGTPDKISLEFDDHGGGLQIRGDSTTINGAATFPLPDSLVRVYIDLGAGDDGVTFRTPFAAELVVRMGAGNDNFGFFDAGAASLRLDLGTGDDFCGFEGGGLGRLFLSGGAGRDRARFYAFGIDRAFFNGGPGADVLDAREVDFGTAPRVVGFEIRL